MSIDKEIMEENKKIFSANIKRYMEQKNVNSSRICADLSFASASFSDWRNGKTYPKIDVIDKLADYFGVSRSDLVDDPADKKDLIIDRWFYEGLAGLNMTHEQKQKVKEYANYIVFEYQKNKSIAENQLNILKAYNDEIEKVKEKGTK